MNRTCRMIACLALGSLVGGCGANPEGTSPTTSAEYADPAQVPGIYAMDVERTTGGTVPDADGNMVQLSAEDLAKVQANNAPEACRLELRADGTFELFMENGEVDFRTGGTWKETARGVDLTTTTINGEPAPAEMAVTETYQREKGYLVADTAGMRVYMKKQPPK